MIVCSSISNESTVSSDLKHELFLLILSMSGEHLAFVKVDDKLVDEDEEAVIVAGGGVDGNGIWL